MNAVVLIFILALDFLLRVPTLDVSVVDLTVNLAKPATYAEILSLIHI